ncbi:MAG: divalent metal cation transporter [Planctomycetota bacterium]|jgi:Mn2+/Fe2+ NRAMP family transporter
MERQENIIKGLPMFAPANPEILAKEKAELRGLRDKGVLSRFKWYFSKTGPGWMQSAMTLGGGSAMASLFAGAFLQYRVLWVQPLAMVLGIIMLSALAYQTLSASTKPFYAMKKFIHPSLAWAWAISALVATIIWHFPQYALAAGMTDDIIKTLTGWKPASQTAQTILLLALGVMFLTIATTICWNYGSGRRGIKIFENIIKSVIWFIIFCFAAVVIRSALSEKGIEWAKVFKGFLPLSMPTDKRGISIVMAGFSAAVGINMTFLFGYSYLARGWGKEHKGLATFDLITGMFIPYTLATALMIIAAGCTIYDPARFAEGSTKLSPIEAAAMLQGAGLPLAFSRIIFGLGIIGMAMNAITLHMLVSGFAVCEIFGVEPGGWKYKLACLMPAPGLLGVVIWKYIGAWIAIPTSAVCLLMLPIAYIGFFLLNNSRRYLGEDKPRGRKALVWNMVMLIAIVITLASVAYFIITVVPSYFRQIL